MREQFISVDVEASGPIPGEFSLLTIGACVVDDDTKTFHVQLKPLNRNAVPEAMQVTGLSLEQLERDGQTPSDAMASFAGWIAANCPKDAKPVFVGLNAPFDWSFVNYYFLRFGSENPFGFTALDIKAYYMGATNCTWSLTSSSQMAKRLHPKRTGTHNALEDALYQAELFRLARDLTRK
jgi:DNA polymerase III epsilon subunit-like protein